MKTMGFNFMQPGDVRADPDPEGHPGRFPAVWLQEGMTCSVKLHDGVPIAIELPAA